MSMAIGYEDELSKQIMDAVEPKPQKVRNFWVEVECDGAVKQVGGPRRRDGGIEIRIFMRKHGQAVHALYIEGKVNDDGTLQLEAREGVDFWLPGDGMLAITSAP